MCDIMKRILNIFEATVIFGCVFLCDSDIHCTERESLSNYGILQLNLMKTLYPPPDHETKFKAYSSSHSHKDLHQLRTNMEPPDPYTRFLEPGYPSIINLLKYKELQGVNENNLKHTNNLMKERRKRTIHYRINIKYIQPIDESLKKDPGLLANLNKVFASDPNNNSAEVNKTNIQTNNHNLDVNITDNKKKSSKNKKKAQRIIGLLGLQTMKQLHKNYLIPIHKKDNGISRAHASVPNNNRHEGTDQHSSESTKKQDDVISQVFNTPPPQLFNITENKSDNVTTTETGYKMTQQSKQKKLLVGTVDKNGASAQTASSHVGFIYSTVLFVLLFPQL